MTDAIANEAELIQTYLAPLARTQGALGLRDDAGYFTPPPGTDVVVTTDPIVSDVHFLAGERPDDIAWKALAVNVSDLAAKGAVPIAYTMSLAFPEAPTHAFMQLFASGLDEVQSQFGCTLIGGDTDRTNGPLSIAITAFGLVPSGRIVKRTSAQIGDAIFVTGTLGDAALGLVLHQHPGRWDDAVTSGDKGFLMARYLRPEPRLELAPLLRAHASAALDVSDGLAKDLARIVNGPGGCADIRFADLPLSPSAQVVLALEPAQSAAVISGGDDYEILFAVPQESVEAFRRDSLHLPFRVTEIGTIVRGSGVVIRDAAEEPMVLGKRGWDHFSP